MCLVLLAFRACAVADVLLVGNRDEDYLRPSAPPAPLSRTPWLFGGQDLQAQGTWLAVNAQGMVAALTNRYRPPQANDAELRSRGEIIPRLLAHTSPDAAAQWLTGLDARLYRPFALLFGNAQQFFCYDPHPQTLNAPVLQALAPGCYALANTHLNDRSWPKVAQGLVTLEQALRLDAPQALQAIKAYMRSTQPQGPESTPPPGFTHDPRTTPLIRGQRYGTVSSAIISLGGQLGNRFYFADKPDLDNALQHHAAPQDPYQPLNAWPKG